MRISYDAEADALSISFRDTSVTRREPARDIGGHYNEQGQLAGLEIRDAGQLLGDLSTLRHVVLEGLGPPVSAGKPPSTIVASHIVLDERGVAWIDDTNVKVIEVVLDKLGDKLTPEEIYEEHYRNLSLAQIHAAFSYYYDHQAEFDAEIGRQLREYRVLHAAQGTDTPVHRKLRAAGKNP
jgi:uncharacterized protein (DUF433 family)/uncharacterized protein YuzE